jgi:hypothetical protein
MRLIHFVMGASYSIVICCVIAIVRFRQIHPSFRPFIWLAICAMMHEIVSFVVIRVLKDSNAISYNVFILVEGLLWLWQFSNWRPNTSRRNYIGACAVVFCVIWIIESLVFSGIHSFSSIYAIVYSFVLVFLAIDRINELIVREMGNLFTNSKFLICIGVVIFYTYRILVESFYIIRLQESDSFLSNVFAILACVNLLVNLLFALATLWIPSRLKFSLP